MGRKAPLTKDEELESILDTEQSKKPSQEEVDAALVRVRALRTQLRQEKGIITSPSSQDALSVAYIPVIERISEILRATIALKERNPENYTAVAAAYLRVLGEATFRSTQELYQVQPETPEARECIQLQLDLDARLLLEISEFI